MIDWSIVEAGAFRRELKIRKMKIEISLRNELQYRMMYLPGSLLVPHGVASMLLASMIYCFLLKTLAISLPLSRL